MPFVKLDCGILDSTLWVDRTLRDVFLTALLMAEPFETTAPLPQIEVKSLNLTGWAVPPGWYGLVPAASVGIIHRAMIDDREAGLTALTTLGEPEENSRSKDFDGRRLVRVNGGFIVLQWEKYRERDYTTADRSKRYRERKASRRDVTVSRRDITQAEGEGYLDSSLGKAPREESCPAAPDVGVKSALQSNGKAEDAKAIELIDFINTKAGTSYRPVEANLRLVRARLKEYSLYTLGAVVRRQWVKWSADENMRQYFRPATLFGREKCAQYVGQLTTADLEWIAKKEGKTDG